MIIRTAHNAIIDLHNGPPPFRGNHLALHNGVRQKGEHAATDWKTAIFADSDSGEVGWYWFNSTANPKGKAFIGLTSGWNPYMKKDLRRQTGKLFPWRPGQQPIVAEASFGGTPPVGKCGLAFDLWVTEQKDHPHAEDIRLEVMVFLHRQGWGGEGEVTRVEIGEHKYDRTRNEWHPYPTVIYESWLKTPGLRLPITELFIDAVEAGGIEGNTSQVSSLEFKTEIFGSEHSHGLTFGQLRLLQAP